MRLPTLTTSPPSSEGSTCSSSITVLPSAAVSACFSAVSWLSVSFGSGGDGGARLAPLAREHGAEGADHVGGREQAAVLGDEQKEILGQPLDLELVEDGPERAALLLGGEHRTLHQPLQIVEGIERLIEAGEVGMRRRQASARPWQARTRRWHSGRLRPNSYRLHWPRKRLSSRTGAFLSSLVPGPEKFLDWRLHVNRLKPCKRSPGSPGRL